VSLAEIRDKRARRRVAYRTARARAGEEAQHRAQQNYARVLNALKRARRILLNDDFVELLYSQGVRTVPKFIEFDAGWISEHSAKSAGRLDHVSIEFAALWLFLYPLLENEMIVDYLRRAWPGFIPEFKDVFILLVVEGPFPPLVFGHQGRRHAADYFGAHTRKKKKSKPHVR
jgi:hypothetical protein